MRNVSSDINVAPPAIQSVKIIREGFPIPGKPFRHHDLGNIFDTLHHADEHFAIRGTARREANATIA